MTVLAGGVDVRSDLYHCACRTCVDIKFWQPRSVLIVGQIHPVANNDCQSLTSCFLPCFHREISLERAERVYCKLFRFPSTISKNISLLTKRNAITKYWKNSVASQKRVMINLNENYFRLRSSIMAIRRIPKWSSETLYIEISTQHLVLSSVGSSLIWKKKDAWF